VEVLGEPFSIDRRAGDDQAQFGASVDKVGEVGHEHIDLDRSLVGFVDDDAIISFQERVALDLGQQDSVGHELDQRGLFGSVLEADFKADDLSELGIEFFG
jgi:hypothetical protein